MDVVEQQGRRGEQLAQPRARDDAEPGHDQEAAGEHHRDDRAEHGERLRFDAEIKPFPLSQPRALH